LPGKPCNLGGEVLLGQVNKRGGLVKLSFVKTKRDREANYQKDRQDQRAPATR
jgi:hypothetical protein